MKIIILAFLGFFAMSAFALPRAPFNALEKKLSKSAAHLLNQETYDFEGIVKLSNCSGSLVTFNGMPSTAKAWVMTNGHCIQKPGGYLNHGEVWLNRPMTREMKLFDAKMKLHPIKATKILYATMTGTDLAFYELSQSYEEIETATGVRPLIMASFMPFPGLEIEIISGYWDRGWSCSIDYMVNELREGAWTWFNSIRYTATCDTMGGTSGSPLTAKGERTVIGVNNTSNENGEQCTVNNPCEVHEDGPVISEKGVRYGQHTWFVSTCLTPDFQIDLTLQNCEMNF